MQPVDARAVLRLFEHHKPDYGTEKTGRREAIRSAGFNLAMAIVKNTVEGDSRAMAVHFVRQAVMMANDVVGDKRTLG